MFQRCPEGRSCAFGDFWTNGGLLDKSGTFGQFGGFLDNLGDFWTISMLSGECGDFWTILGLSGQSGDFWTIEEQLLSRAPISSTYIVCRQAYIFTTNNRSGYVSVSKSHTAIILESVRGLKSIPWPMTSVCPTSTIVNSIHQSDGAFMLKRAIPNPVNHGWRISSQHHCQWTPHNRVMGHWC